MVKIPMTDRLQYLFAFFGVFFILLPKMNVIEVSGQTAGIRIDDLIIMFSFITYLIAVGVSGRILSANGYLYFSIYALIVALIVIVSGFPANALYAFRLFEYYMFFIFGWCAYTRLNIVNVAKLIFMINAVVMVLQYFGIVGGFASEGYTSTVDSRVIGLTGGPWEVGFIINCVYVILRQHSHGQRRNMILFVVTFFFVLLTGARMPTLAHLVAFMMIEYRYTKNRAAFIAVFSVISSLMLLLLLTIENPVQERSVNLFTMRNIEVFDDFYQSIEISKVFSGFPEFPADNGADMSWLMRVSKWSYAFKSWFSEPFYIVFGVGAGTWGTALDGGWLRLLTENGVLGFGLFLLFLFKSIRLIPSAWILFSVISINMTMIDIYISYKSMALILFIAGYYACFHQSEKLCRGMHKHYV